MRTMRLSRISSKRLPGNNMARDAILAVKTAWFMRAMSHPPFWERIENWETVGSCSNGNSRVRQRHEPGASAPNEDFDYRSERIPWIARRPGPGSENEKDPRSGAPHK